MNPKSYCIQHGVATADFIKKAQAVAPKYSKVTHCMASDPKCGVMLRPEVANHITGKPERRKNPCRLSFRCAEGLLHRFSEAREALGFETNQQALLFMVNWFLSEMEKAAPGAGTPETAKAKNLTNTITDRGGNVNA